MSKITINYDTSDKTMSVKMGSTELENVSSIYVYPKWDEDEGFSIEVAQISRDEKEGIVTITRTMASQDGETWAEKKVTKKKKDKSMQDEGDDCTAENLAKSLFPHKNI